MVADKLPAPVPSLRAISPLPSSFSSWQLSHAPPQAHLRCTTIGDGKTARGAAGVRAGDCSDHRLPEALLAEMAQRAFTSYRSLSF